MSSPSQRALPGHAAARCEARERNAAIVALAACLLLGAATLALAIKAMRAAGTVDAPSPHLGSRDAGTAGGVGAGARTGDGSALDGSGPGGARQGEAAADRTFERADDAPRGVATGAVPETNPPEGEAPVAGTEAEVPTFGFTPPTPEPRDEAREMPSPRVPAGLPSGGASPGAAGAGGSGGGEAQVANVIDNFPNSRVTINLDATESMRGSRDALANILPGLFARLEGGSIAVMVFRDIDMGEGNEEIIRRTRRTLDRRAVDAMIGKIMAIPPMGGGDEAETGYQLVISNIRKAPKAPKATPNVEIIITDAPEKHAHLLKVLRSLAKDKNTRVFSILTATSPPIHSELTDPPAGSEPGSPSGTAR